KSNNVVIFYIDGVAQPAATYGSVFTFSTPVAIGARGDNLNNSFYGSIDEISLYARALSAADVQSIYNADGTGKCRVAVPPFIIAQPTNQTVTAGANVTFSVVAGGTAPLSYQWRFNGTNITGATASSFTIVNAQPANAGAYSVVVS